jgi:hypothetical protein
VYSSDDAKKKSGIGGVGCPKLWEEVDILLFFSSSGIDGVSRQTNGIRTEEGKPTKEYPWVKGILLL